MKRKNLFVNSIMPYLFGMTLMLVTTVSANAAAYVPKIIAGVVKADSWTMGNNKEGIYQLEVKPDGQLTQLKEERDVYLAPLGGAVYQDGTMYGIHFKQEWDPYDQANTYTIYNIAYDMSDWTRVKGQALSNMYGNLISSCGITHDPITGKNFGIFYNFNISYQVINRKLATIDFVDTEKSGAPKKEVIGIVETPFAAIAASDNGFLYGVGQDGYLYIINKEMPETGLVEVFPIGDLGIEDISTNPSSMTFDPRTKKLYWCYVSTSQKSYLYEINYNIGQVGATKIMQVPDNSYLVNMYIAPMEADDNAPAAVADLETAFEGESVTGNVLFTMPTLTYSGDPLEGEMSYTVYADDVVVAKGQAVAGAHVTQSVSVKSEGQDVVLRVAAKNVFGEGAPCKISRYIGRDTPLPVSNLKLSYNSTTEFMHLTWEAPTTGLHELPLTESNLSYNVMRLPDSVVVAEGLQLPAFSEKIVKTTELQNYYYDVVVVNGIHLSDTASSNKVIVGQPLLPPYDEDFTSPSRFDRFIVVDANNDGKSWQRYHRFYEYSGTTVDYAQIIANTQKNDNDYLLTPPLLLEKGGRYTLKFTASKSYSAPKYDQKLRVLLGSSDDLADYVVLMDTIEIADVNLESFFTEFKIDEDGDYRLAFHAVSDAGSDALNIDELHLSASLLPSAPDTVTHIVATADASGYLKATVSFVAPSVTLHGDPLAAISRIEALDADDKVIGTLLNPIPGSNCTMEISNLKNGIGTYYLVAYADENPGARASFSFFAGQDYPLPPTNVVLADNGTEAVLTWDAPQKGFNGLPLNPELITYNLYGVDQYGQEILMKSDIKSPYHTGIATLTGEQQLLYYALDAQNTAGLSELVATNGLVVGQPYELPYVDVFDKTNQKFVWIEGDYADWNIGLAQLSSDGDENGYSMAFEPNRADYGFYNLGKLSLAGSEKPVLAFDYYAVPATEPTSLSVLIDTKQNGQADLLATYDFQQATAMEWKHVVLDLSAFKNEPYIIVKFGMVSPQSANPQIPILFDDLHIDEEATLGIQSVTCATASKGIYRLDGTRVNALGRLSKGIYVIDGRKTIIK